MNAAQTEVGSKRYGSASIARHRATHRLKLSIINSPLFHMGIRASPLNSLTRQKGWPGAQRCAGPLVYLIFLVERNRDVDYRVAEEIDEERLSGHEI
jgi:hypothetical protein